MCCTLAGIRLPPTTKQSLSVAAATWQRYSLPLQKPLTTAAAAAGCRKSIVLQLALQQGDRSVSGVGEIAPLPGDLALLIWTVV